MSCRRRRTLDRDERASGATPTTPTLFSGAAAVPGDVGPVPVAVVGRQAGLTQFRPVEMSMFAAGRGGQVDPGVDDGDPCARAAEARAVCVAAADDERADPRDPGRVGLGQVDRVVARDGPDAGAGRSAAAAAAVPLNWNPLIAWV